MIDTGSPINAVDLETNDVIFTTINKHDYLISAN